MTLAPLLALLVPFAAAQESPSITSHVPPAKQWLKRYPIRAYGAFWHIDLEVKDLEAAREKAFAIAREHGGASTTPVERMASSEKWKYQQLSYRFERKPGLKALKKLEKIGKVRRETLNENLLPEAAPEIAAKLERLRAEREAGKTALEPLSAIRALVDELIEHLERAQTSFDESRDRVLLTVVLEEAAG